MPGPSMAFTQIQKAPVFDGPSVLNSCSISSSANAVPGNVLFRFSGVCGVFVRPVRLPQSGRGCGFSVAGGVRAGLSERRILKAGDGFGSRNAGKRRSWGVMASSSSARSVDDASFGGGGNGMGGRGGGGGGGGDGDNGYGGSDGLRGGKDGGKDFGGGLFGAFLTGWRERVRADSQFPFKVLTEEVIGVGACVLGDMASRPNFGLNELDLVFSTIIVGSILNFTLMYMLAPSGVAGAISSKLPGIFSCCPSGHMFEAGAYSVLDRFGTFVYKGAQFAVVGFAAGLVGTALSTALLNTRKKMDPNFVTQNRAPPTVLNAATWAIHMGLSSNSRYQALNGIEFTLGQVLTPLPFKLCVFVLRGLNNVLGGTSFVYLARLTGSQNAPPPPPPKALDEDDRQLVSDDAP